MWYLSICLCNVSIIAKYINTLIWHFFIYHATLLQYLLYQHWVQWPENGLLIMMKVTREIYFYIFIIILLSLLRCEPSTVALIAQQLSQREARHSDAFTVSSNRCSISNPTPSPSMSGSKSWLGVRIGCGHCVPYEIHALLLVVIGWVVSVVTWCLTGTAPPYCQLAVGKLKALLGDTYCISL